MSLGSLFSRAEPLRPTTPLHQCLVRGVIWGWSIGGAWLLVLAFRGCVAWGPTETVRQLRGAGGFMLASAVASTLSGICASFVAPFLTGYPRSCVLGALSTAPILSLVYADGYAGFWEFLNSGIVMPTLVGGMLAGALGRWQMGDKAWPVGDQWP